jgi:hypothetical protein
MAKGHEIDGGGLLAGGGDGKGRRRGLRICFWTLGTA